jgi:hypothetical protein
LVASEVPVNGFTNLIGKTLHQFHQIFARSVDKVVKPCTGGKVVRNPVKKLVSSHTKISRVHRNLPPGIEC